MTTTENIEYGPDIPEESPLYWAGFLSIGLGNGTRITATEDQIMDQLAGDITDDIHKFTVDVNHHFGGRLCLGFELMSDGNEFAAYMIAGLGIQTALKLGLHADEIHLARCGLIDGVELNRARAIGAHPVQRTADYLKLSNVFERLHAWRASLEHKQHLPLQSVV